MRVICKDWQALPVSATTVNTPNIENRIEPTPQPSYTSLPDNIQQPTTHISSKPDIVELHKIIHNELIEPREVNIPSLPVFAKPKKRSCIIQQPRVDTWRVVAQLRANHLLSDYEIIIQLCFHMH